MGVDGGFHADGADQLQGMVLHHVAQRTGLVVEGAALFHAQVFCDGDLDVGNVLAPPDRFEQRVAEAQRKQVLYRGLSQVVVDAEHLVFVQHLAHRRVDRLVRGQVVAQRLFEHHPRVRAVQAGSGDLLDRLREQGWCRRDVHHHGVGVARFQQVGQPCVIFGFRQVEPEVIKHRGESLEFLVGRPLGAFDCLEARLDQVAVLVVRQIIARHADDATALGQAAVAKCLEQRRHELAPGQVASAAEQNEIETHG